MRALVWFRNDLRTHDNPALYEACRRADRGVLAVFTVCPEQWLEHDAAPVRIDFVLRNLRELSESLEKLNIALRVVQTARFKGVPDALAELATRFECDELFLNREYEVNEHERDERVAEHLGIPVRAFTDQCVFEPGEVRTGEGKFYSVFTPFKRAWCRAVDEDRSRIKPLSRPRRQPEMVGEPDPVPESVPGFDASSARADLWPAGESTARRRLGAFIGKRLGSYHEDRDFPALDGTSVLSPYLACGAISIRQCVAAAAEENSGNLDSGQPGAKAWISECAWREFYRHVLVGFPRVSMHGAFRRSTERIEWNRNDEHLAAWCEGRTGFPIVDAGMRQLERTGWMHNRLRMVTAMFLSKNLFLDWRLGERHFMRNLIDGDLASNNGGWQWSASTGTDAAPYFRILNPCSQSKRFDPDGEFIREYVPELADVRGPGLHDPAKLTDEIRRETGYPSPIVDLATTRLHAIEAFKALRD